MLAKSVLHLSECYAKMDRVEETIHRVEETIHLHKSRGDEIGKESMNHGAILSFAEILQNHHKTSRALAILEEHLEAIERSWGKREQCIA